MKVFSITGSLMSVILFFIDQHLGFSSQGGLRRPRVDFKRRGMAFCERDFQAMQRENAQHTMLRVQRYTRRTM